MQFSLRCCLEAVIFSLMVCTTKAALRLLKSNWHRQPASLDEGKMTCRFGSSHPGGNEGCRAEPSAPTIAPQAGCRCGCRRKAAIATAHQGARGPVGSSTSFYLSLMSHLHQDASLIYLHKLFFWTCWPAVRNLCCPLSLLGLQCPCFGAILVIVAANADSFCQQIGQGCKLVGAHQQAL